MMLRYSFDMAEEADLVEDAVRRALASGVQDQRYRPAEYRSRLDPGNGRHRASGIGKSGLRLAVLFRRQAVLTAR